MKKKKSSGGGANWMDTYGDMVTLLLCFFVLLYSMSTISEDAWKNLVMSFNPNAVSDIRETPEGGGFSADQPGSGVSDIPMLPEKTSQEEIEQDMEHLFQTIQAYIAEAGVTESVSVSKDGGKVFVTFNGTAFFKGDSFALTAEALPVLDNMGEILSRVARSIDEIQVIGHTAQYRADQPNNPETDYMLSCERAAKVTSYIVSHTDNRILDPAKFFGAGKGQWHPVASNDTAEGKAMNRRVEMIISGRNLEEELKSGEIESYTTNGQAQADGAGGVESYTTTGQAAPAGGEDAAAPAAPESTAPTASPGGTAANEP